jgi:hypothetical protein
VDHTKVRLVSLSAVGDPQGHELTRRLLRHYKSRHGQKTAFVGPQERTDIFQWTVCHCGRASLLDPVLTGSVSKFLRVCSQSIIAGKLRELVSLNKKRFCQACWPLCPESVRAKCLDLGTK